MLPQGLFHRVPVQRFAAAHCGEAAQQQMTGGQGLIRQCNATAQAQQGDAVVELAKCGVDHGGGGFTVFERAQDLVDPLRQSAAEPGQGGAFETTL